MNRRSMLKFLAALPLMGVIAPKVVLAAHPEIEWRFGLFDFECRMGVCGIMYFENQHDSEHRLFARKKGELRMKRSAAMFAIPVSAHLSGARGMDDVQKACADLVNKAKLKVIENFRADANVVYDDDLLEGKEVML